MTIPKNLLIPGNYATSLLSRRYYRLNIIFCGSLRIRGRFRIRIIFQKFARILDMQRVTDAHGDIETHPTDITLSGLERANT